MERIGNLNPTRVQTLQPAFGEESAQQIALPGQEPDSFVSHAAIATGVGAVAGALAAKPLHNGLSDYVARLNIRKFADTPEEAVAAIEQNGNFR